MTTERIRSVGILCATLLIGVMLGILIPGFFHKVSSGRHDQGNQNNKQRNHVRGTERKGDWFTNTLNRIVEPDSIQKGKIKPVAQWASARLDSIEQNANFQASLVIDSVKIKLRSVITEKQWKRLDEFDQHAKEKWYRHDKGHPKR